MVSKAPDETASRSVRDLAPPVLIALLPLASLATLQFLLPIIAPALMASVGLRPEAYGWLGGALGAGSVAFYLISHAITPVLGPVGTLRLGTLVGIGGGMLILSGHWPMLLLGSFLVGLGFGTTTPAGSQIIADFAPRKTWGTLFSLRQAGVPAGGVIAAVIAASTLDGDSWEATVAVALVPVALTALLLSLAPARFNQKRRLERFAGRRLADWRNLTRPFHTIRGEAGLPLLVLAGCLLAMGHATATQFLVIYLNAEIGVPVAQGAFFYATVQTCAMTSRVLVGALADRYGTPMSALRLMAPLSACSCLILAGFGTGWSWGTQFAVVLLMGVTVGTWNALFLAEIARRAPPAQISQFTANAAAFIFFAYTITPPLVGLLAITAGWRPTFLIIACAPLMAGLILRSNRSAGVDR